MEGPMKGAAIGHAKQRHSHCRYIGLTELQSSPLSHQTLL
ncbi:decarboxylase family protein [Vibrio ishigakensis]|uniref:Decarboxylase family protein n=1 Tax=Vibrio ishigakensis TaxID=1481914 RepID=A0A0B8QEC0_9VIBR|nr:decarboxylase family protein [Vibrio ishigakensis]